MITRNQPIPRSQRGMATLLTALMVLFVMTLITLYATQSTVMETNVSANQYRTDQAYAAASGAMDYAEGRFDSVGVDELKDGTVDCTAAAPCEFSIEFPDDATTPNVNEAQTLPARYFFCDPDQLDPGAGTLLTSAEIMSDPTICGETDSAAIFGAADSRYEDQVGIVAVGFSDDRTGQRVMIKAAAVNEAISDGPGSPLSNGGAVGLTGNMTVINRFQDFTIWSGKDIGTKGSADTYIAGSDLGDGICMTNYRAAKDDDPSTLYDETLHARCTAHDNTAMADTEETVKATDKDRAANYDVIDNDPNLDSLIPSPDPALTDPLYTEPTDRFWNNFFNLSKSEFVESAISANQYDVTPTDGMSGYIWWTGDLSNLADIGNLADRESALLVVTGNLRQNGGDIYGVIYVMGDWDVAGSPVIQGAVIVRGKTTGNGTPVVIYDPNAFGDVGGNLSGAIVGSWRDW